MKALVHGNGQSWHLATLVGPRGCLAFWPLEGFAFNCLCFYKRLSLISSSGSSMARLEKNKRYFTKNIDQNNKRYWKQKFRKYFTQILSRTTTVNREKQIIEEVKQTGQIEIIWQICLEKKTHRKKSDRILNIGSELGEESVIYKDVNFVTPGKRVNWRCVLISPWYNRPSSSLLEHSSIQVMVKRFSDEYHNDDENLLNNKKVLEDCCKRLTQLSPSLLNCFQQLFPGAHLHPQHLW